MSAQERLAEALPCRSGVCMGWTHIADCPANYRAAALSLIEEQRARAERAEARLTAVRAQVEAVFDRWTLRASPGKGMQAFLADLDAALATDTPESTS